ncbi:hypothetical protein NBE98_09895 [Clostridium swellfunianum]|uniref:HipA family kinase n=1 Tax=Clostridium swellfunianum TaxID=1367462 RepID=UPI00202EE784|nr:HipA family kinase [Clostridium swellfunianum]MCM0648686.1 hypothetical protein [Clostridium swellfunianum]
MDILNIDSLDFVIGNGCTEPIVGTGGNNKVVVKPFNNIQGNKVLINELVCYLIAQQLHLTTPECGICKIDKFTKVDQSIYNLTDFGHNNNGLGFYSTYLPNVTVINNFKLIEFSQNYKWLIPSILLFDHLIYNSDRNKGNLLINTTKQSKKMYIIDHSHTFNKQCLWDSNQLSFCIKDNDIEDVTIMESNSYLYSMFKKVIKVDLVSMLEAKNLFLNRLNKEFFYNIVNNIPSEWESNTSENRALAEYLYYRFKNLDTLINIILSYQY